jgi:flagellar motor switch protein FliG
MDEILSFSDDQIKDMLQKVSNDDLAAAMKDCSVGVWEKIVKHFSRRATNLFIEMLESPEVQSLDADSVRRAQAVVLSILLRGSNA